MYEHGIAAMLAEQEVFGDDDRWAGLPPAELIRSAVAEMVGISLRHRRFLGSVVLISAAHEEVARRGSRYAERTRRRLHAGGARARDDIRHADPEAAARACFGTVFATTIIRVAYGPAFATSSPVDDDTFVADLGETAVRYLLADVMAARMGENALLVALERYLRGARGRGGREGGRGGAMTQAE